MADLQLSFRQRLADLASEHEQLQARCHALAVDNNTLRARLAKVEKAAAEPTERQRRQPHPEPAGLEERAERLIAYLAPQQEKDAQDAQAGCDEDGEYDEEGGSSASWGESSGASSHSSSQSRRHSTGSHQSRCRARLSSTGRSRSRGHRATSTKRRPGDSRARPSRAHESRTGTSRAAGSRAGTSRGGRSGRGHSQRRSCSGSGTVALEPARHAASRPRSLSTRPAPRQQPQQEYQHRHPPPHQAEPQSQQVQQPLTSGEAPEVNKAQLVQGSSPKNGEPTWQAHIMVPQITGGVNYAGRIRTFTVRCPVRLSEAQALDDARQLEDAAPGGPQAVRAVANELQRTKTTSEPLK